MFDVSEIQIKKFRKPWIQGVQLWIQKDGSLKLLKAEISAREKSICRFVLCRCEAKAGRRERREDSTPALLK